MNVPDLRVLGRSWPDLVERERSQTTAYSRMKSNVIPDIRLPVGRIHVHNVHNVLNKQFSSFSVSYRG